MQESTVIVATLGNRSYKMKVTPAQEASVRAALDAIKDTTASLRKQFPGRDEQDYLAMTLIDFVSNAKEMPSSLPSSSSPLLDELQHINKLLDL